MVARNEISNLNLDFKDLVLDNFCLMYINYKKEIRLKELIVKEEGERLDKYIAEIEDISRVAVQRLIEEGNITVNEKLSRPSYKLQMGDKINIIIPEAKPTNLEAQKIPLDIIYEDDDIIVVNKAKGMVVHPAARKPRWYTCKCSDGTLQKFIWGRW